MASKRKRKGKRRFPAHLRKYWFKSKKRSRRRHRKAHHTMARKRRRRHHRHHRRHTRRRGGGGGRGGWLPGSEDLKLFAAGAVAGVVEAKAKADGSFVLNKVPRPVTALGYTGGTALAAWAVSKFVGGSIGSYARLFARANAVVAAYQMGKQGGAHTTVAIEGLADGPEAYIDAEGMGALDAEGTMAGVPFDDAVYEAGSRG